MTRDHAALAVLLGLAASGSVRRVAAIAEDLAFPHGHPTLRILGKGNRPAVVSVVSRGPDPRPAKIAAESEERGLSRLVSDSACAAEPGDQLIDEGDGGLMASGDSQ